MYGLRMVQVEEPAGHVMNILKGIWEPTAGTTKCVNNQLDILGTNQTEMYPIIL